MNTTRISSKEADFIIDKMIATKNAERRFGKTGYLKAGQKKYKQPLEFSRFARVYKAGPPKVVVDRQGRVAGLLGAFLCALPGIRATARTAESVQVEAMLAVTLFLVTAGSDDNDQVRSNAGRDRLLASG
jgi:hypothetical protein